MSKGLLSVEKMNENGRAVVFDGDMSFVVNKAIGEVNHLDVRTATSCWTCGYLRPMWLRRGVLAGSHSLEAVVVKGIRPPKTSRTEVARGYCEKKTVDSEEEEVEAEGQKEAIVREVRDTGCPTSEERECHYKVSFQYQLVKSKVIDVFHQFGHNPSVANTFLIHDVTMSGSCASVFDNRSWSYTVFINT